MQQRGPPDWDQNTTTMGLNPEKEDYLGGNTLAPGGPERGKRRGVKPRRAKNLGRKTPGKRGAGNY